MTTVTVLGTANLARVENWLTYEMREWWNEVGQQQYSYVHILDETTDAE